MTQTTPASSPTPATRGGRVVDVELLALDLAACTRCTGTRAHIEQAIALVHDVAGATGTEVRLHEIVVDSEEAARRHRFVSSPTIRVDGRDLVFDTVESRCDSCTDLCGCDEGTDCRVWRYQGQEFTEAPVGLVVEGLLRAIAESSGAPVAPSADYTLPENLRRFFAGRASHGAVAATDAGCCPPAELASCCAPAGKTTCCGSASATKPGHETGAVATAPASCGCT